MKRLAMVTAAVVAGALPIMASDLAAVEPTRSPRVRDAIVVDQGNRRWLRFADGQPFFLCGAGDPENFLYRGTRDPDGTRDGDQMALIAKLAGAGANGIYFQIIRSHGGDGGPDHNPFVGSDPSRGLNEAMLDQWEGWFAAMDEAGVLAYMFLFDDGANVWGRGDAVPPGEAAFLRAIVDRFEHHRSLVWVIAEEYGEAFSPARVSGMAAIVRAADDFGHPIAVHKNAGLSFAEFADDPNIDQFAIQYNDKSPAALHAGMVRAFREAAGRYGLNMAESASHGTGKPARLRNWATALGGAYVMVLRWDIASTRVADLEGCGRLVRFMQSTDFQDMAPRDDLAFGGAEYVLADPPGSYILYASALAGEIGVRGVRAGTYRLRWLDVVTGLEVEQTGVRVADGDVTWPRPPGIGKELAVSIAAERGGR